MNCEIRKLNWPIIHLLPHEHQPFDVIGRFVPVYDGEKWTYREINRQAIFLAVCDNLCVGAIRVSTGWSGDGIIEDLAVDILYRRQGLGRKLMDSAVKWCRDQHYRRIMLETQDNNLQACRFYITYGFALCGINTQKYALLSEYKDETALYFYLDIGECL